MKSYSDNPNSIKFYIKRFLIKNKADINGKTIVDLPAGNGITSTLINELGGKPLPFDLFPEYFTAEGLTCKQADVMSGIPLSNGVADMVICQEGIEHFSDQFAVFKEFNRILTPQGKLIITTPNYSNLRARMSYFIGETERFNSMMPPNEIDSIWMNNTQDSNQIYFGHLFLIGIQRLRTLAKLSGFKISSIEPTKIKSTALILLILWYPFIYLSNYLAYRKNIRKNKGFNSDFQKQVYSEQFKLNTNFRVLVDSHLFVVFEKENESEEVLKSLKSVHKEFGLT
ncbi:MAG: methyltransferase domain-containing protein [Bacteroidota bacterium]